MIGVIGTPAAILRIPNRIHANWIGILANARKILANPTGILVNPTKILASPTHYSLEFQL